MLFSNLLKKAKEEGYYISIHAGEFGDERNIYESIRHCFADRIGHGNNINNTELIKLIKNKGILIELCPCSNSIINKNFNINKYNFYTYLQKGIAISINSDDPGLLGKTISDNYLYILKNFKVDVTDLIKIEKNAIKHLIEMPLTA